MAKTAFIEESDSKAGWFELRSPYDRELVHRLGQELEQKSRYWDKEEKVWMIHESAVEMAQKIAEDYFEVEVM